VFDGSLDSNIAHTLIDKEDIIRAAVDTVRNIPTPTPTPVQAAQTKVAKAVVDNFSVDVIPF
jgi:hypothetical protein